MAKVHISLVGGQPTPVYQGILLSKPDKIILICSNETNETATIIKEKLKQLNYFYVQIEQWLIDELTVIRAKIDELFRLLSADDDISMNLSSGVKLWSLLFAKYCPFDNAHIYCIAQNGKVLDIQGASEQSRVDFDMFTQFVLLGHPLEKYVSFSEYNEQDKHNAAIIKKLYTNNTFQKLLKDIQKQIQDQYSNNKEAFIRTDQCVDYGNEQYIEWHAEERVFSISLNNTSYFELQGNHASDMLLNTAWFEYETASMLAQIYGAENVYMNCVFKASNGTDKNEIDIIVNTGQKLLFVECKTHISEITAIDKFASVVRNYGGNGSKALFVTLAEMNSTRKEKCKDNHIDTLFIQIPQIERGKIVRNKNGQPMYNTLSIPEMKTQINSILQKANQ